MTDATATFLDEITSKPPPMLPRTINGKIRLDLAHDTGVDHWILSVESGSVSVAHDERAADLVIHADKDVFDRIACGEANFHAALFQNKVGVEGSLKMFGMLYRMLPGPPGARGPRRVGRGERPAR
jgi:putative sterol carrier protein